jgi:hypothetical protein
MTLERRREGKVVTVVFCDLNGAAVVTFFAARCEGVRLAQPRAA